jgi:transposase
MTLALVFAALLAVACVAAVALPFLREPEAKEDALNVPDEATRRRLALVEERDRALAALRELELDHRTGKVSDEDYRALHASLRRQAATALAALEAKTPATDTFSRTAAVE